MNIALLTSLGLFFEVQLLMVCVDDDASADGSYVSSVHGGGGAFKSWTVSFVRAADVPAALPSFKSHERGILVACDTFDLDRVSGLNETHFRSNLVWLVPETSLADLTPSTLPLRLDSFLLSYAKSNGSAGDVLLREVYKAKGQTLLEGHFGHWRSDTGLTVPQPATWERRRDLRGTVLVNTVLNWAPLAQQLANESVVGLIPDVLKIIQNRMNFSLTNVKPEDGNWGSFVTGEDGQTVLTGMAGQLARKEADLCGSTLTATLERGRHIDFTLAVLEDKTTVTILNPAYRGGIGGQNEVNLLVYLTVFTKWTWLCILATAVATAIHYVVLSSATSEFPLGKGEAGALFASAFYMFFLSLIQKLENIGDPFTVASKMAFMTVSAVTFILYNYYVGDMTATMTVQGARVQLRTFADLLEADYTMYVQEGTVTEDFFTQSQDPVIRAIYRSSRPLLIDDYFTFRFLEFAMREPRAATYGDSISFVGIKELLVLSDFEQAQMSHLAIPLQKDSEFKSAFDFHLTKMEQTGVLKALRHKWMEDDRPADLSHRIFQEDAKALGYNNLAFPTIVLGFGTAGAAAMVIAEFWTRRLKSTETKSSPIVHEAW